MNRIAIIGGSGLENPDILKNVTSKEIDTPFGKPSSDLLIGEINGVEVILLSRHDRQHTIPPTQINNAANIWALKEAGCTQIIATTACGSLKEEIDRGNIVLLDQFIDFTKHRRVTFFDKFENGEMKHTPMADPFSKELREIFIKKAEELKLPYHKKGTVITIEGPRFSTRAESRMFQAWGADVINMSTAPECALANEIGIPYASIAMSTDYDCWKEGEEPVSWEEIIKIFHQNVDNVLNLIIESLPELNKLKF